MGARQLIAWVRRQHPALVGMAVGAAPVLACLVGGLMWATWQSLFVPQDPTLIGPFDTLLILGFYATFYLLPVAAGIGAGVGVLACSCLRRTCPWQT